MKLTNAKIIELAHEYSINLDVVSPSHLRKAINIEFEHTNNPREALKVVCDHMREFPDYYKRLIRMEKAAARYWESREKPDVFIKK